MDSTLQSSFLPEDFTPSKNEIIVGRGKRVLHHEGNKKLRLLVQAEIEPYSAATNRAAKTVIITRIFKTIMSDTAIGFVKRDTASKRYFKMEYTASKTTIAQYFRDALADNYKSSKKYKQQLRDAIKEDVPAPASSCSGAPTSPVPALTAQQIRQVSSCSSRSHVHVLPNIQTVMGSSLPPFQMNQAPPLPQLSFSGVKDVDNFEDLSNILSSASALIDADDDFDLTDMVDKAQQDNEKWDATSKNQPALLSALFHGFGKDLDYSANPFEPTPLSESV